MLPVGEPVDSSLKLALKNEAGKSPSMLVGGLHSLSLHKGCFTGVVGVFDKHVKFPHFPCIQPCVQSLMYIMSPLDLPMSLKDDGLKYDNVLGIPPPCHDAIKFGGKGLGEPPTNLPSWGVISLRWKMDELAPTSLPHGIIWDAAIQV